MNLCQKLHFLWHINFSNVIYISHIHNRSLIYRYFILLFNNSINFWKFIGLFIFVEYTIYNTYIQFVYLLLFNKMVLLAKKYYWQSQKNFVLICPFFYILFLVFFVISGPLFFKYSCPLMFYGYSFTNLFIYFLQYMYFP